jgi:hypothetical protein
LFEKGYSKTLTFQDLYEPLKKDRSIFLGDKLERLFFKILDYIYDFCYLISYNNVYLIYIYKGTGMQSKQEHKIRTLIQIYSRLSFLLLGRNSFF